jgi:sugar phosphate isomerase/epimerase
MIQFGVASTCLDQPDSIRYCVEWAIGRGFSGVEFNAPEMYLAEQSMVDLKWALDMSVEHNLRYTYHFPPSALPGSFVAATRERELEEFSKEIYVAGELGVEVAIVHPGRLHVPGVDQGDESEDDRLVAISYFVDWAKDAAKEAESAGVVIGFENMHYNPGWVIRSHHELSDVIDEIDHESVGITLDVGHAWGSGGIDAGIEMFGERIKHVQVHDARGPEGAGNVRDQHLEIGTGLVKWDSVGELVGGREFLVVLETSGRDPDREGMALRSRDLLQKQWNS